SGGKQLGLDLHGGRRQSGGRPGSGADGQIAAGELARGQRHARMGLLQEGPSEPGGAHASRERRKVTQEGGVPVSPWPGVRKERQQRGSSEGARTGAR